MHHSFNIVCDVNSRFVRLLFHLGCELNDGDNALLASAVGGHFEHVAPQLHIPLLSPSCPPGNFAFIDVENPGMKAPPFFPPRFAVTVPGVNKKCFVWHCLPDSFRRFSGLARQTVSEYSIFADRQFGTDIHPCTVQKSPQSQYDFFFIEKQECSESCQQVEENLNKLCFNHLLQILAVPDAIGSTLIVGIAGHS